MHVHKRCLVESRLRFFSVAYLHTLPSMAVGLSLMAILKPQRARVIMLAVCKSVQSVGLDVRGTISALELVQKLLPTRRLQGS